MYHSTETKDWRFQAKLGLRISGWLEIFFNKIRLLKPKVQLLLLNTEITCLNFHFLFVLLETLTLIHELVYHQDHYNVDKIFLFWDTKDHIYYISFCV